MSVERKSRVPGRYPKEYAVGGFEIPSSMHDFCYTHSLTIRAGSSPDSFSGFANLSHRSPAILRPCTSRNALLPLRNVTNPMPKAGGSVWNKFHDV